MINIKELISQNISLSELKSNPIRLIRSWFWNSPQITSWTFMFLEKRLRNSDSVDFIALRTRLEKISVAGITFSRKVCCAERLPEYWEPTVICYTRKHESKICIAELASTRTFILGNGEEVPVDDVLYWRE